ncbi:hypothetical protein HDU97_003352 [Phlyctochytrium planicorne]|nr:hypothetical protein HDU97_003352 [Phlyctochytrium planicorne]
MHLASNGHQSKETLTSSAAGGKGSPAKSKAAGDDLVAKAIKVLQTKFSDSDVPKATAMHWKIITALWDSNDVFLMGVCLNRLVGILRPWHGQAPLPWPGLSASQIRATVYQSQLALARLFACCDPWASLSHYLEAMETRYSEKWPAGSLEKLIMMNSAETYLEGLYAVLDDFVNSFIFVNGQKPPPSEKRSAFETLSYEVYSYAFKAYTITNNTLFLSTAVTLTLLSVSIAAKAGRHADILQFVMDASSDMSTSPAAWKACDFLSLGSSILYPLPGVSPQIRQKASLLLIQGILIAIKLDDRARLSRFETDAHQLSAMDGASRDLLLFAADLSKAARNQSLYHIDTDLEFRLLQLQDGKGSLVTEEVDALKALASQVDEMRELLRDKLE